VRQALQLCFRKGIRGLGGIGGSGGLDKVLGRASQKENWRCFFPKWDGGRIGHVCSSRIGPNARSRMPA
jgi:hypothetical protein